MRIVMLAAVIGVMIACATPDARPQSELTNESGIPEELLVLSEIELRALIADRWIAREDSFAPNVTSRNEEFFCASGMWGGVGARVPLVGRYTTTGGELCVHYADGESFCRRVLRDANGRYFTQRIRGEPPTQSQIEVRIYRQEHQPHCT
jgi:hypothetical protein